MEEELKNIFDDIAKKIAEEEDNTIAKAFTMYIGDCLRREGIVPILTKVEAPCQVISNGNEYQIASCYGYIFERLDTSAHDKQIRDEVIEELQKDTSITLRILATELMKNQKNYSEDSCHYFSKGIQAFVIHIENFIAEQLKGEQNE